MSHGERVAVGAQEVPKHGQVPVVGSVLKDGGVQAEVGVELKLQV